MKEVGIKEAKNTLSKLIASVLRGERVFLSLRGKRIAELVALEKAPLTTKNKSSRNDFERRG